MARDLRMVATLNDPALRPFLTARDECARRAELERLIDTIAQPVIDRVLGHCRPALSAAGGDEARDVASSVVVRVLEKLESVRTSEHDSMVRLDQYVARVTYNAVADLRRRSAPEWARLKRRLRYAISADARLSMWELPSGTVCGLAAWRERTDVRDHLQLDCAPSLVRDDELPAVAVLALLRIAGAPLHLDTITTVLAGIWDVSEPSPSAATDIADSARGPMAKYETREELQMVWEEIRELPVSQRVALLLNLRDGIGLNAVVLFPLTGVASFDDIAEVMEMPPAQLAELWPRLPLGDLEIAATLSVERQQVINLRKSARARLQRRLALRQKGRR